jgi:hypothetical protein
MVAQQTTSANCTAGLASSRKTFVEALAFSVPTTQSTKMTAFVTLQLNAGFQGRPRKAGYSRLPDDAHINDCSASRTESLLATQAQIVECLQ